jgi:glycogen phosphorylase
MEAFGTSGMKAAMNGVSSLSVLDGWWIEGHLEDVTGWSIGDRVEAGLEPQPGMDTSHAAELDKKLEEKILPCFYKEQERFIEIMRHAIALNGAFFNTQRMCRTVSPRCLSIGVTGCDAAPWIDVRAL